MGDGSRLVLVGTYVDATVGVASGHVAGGGAGAVGVVDCCYVEPAARGVGVGGALVAALLGWFAERGCEAADVAALPGDRETKQLFERFGFSARLLVLHRRLP
jgi:GNAT superfamily N-acetyltransferase